MTLKRREFITLLGGAAAAWPVAAQAQQVRRVAALMASAADDPLSPERRAAFQKRLEQLGWKIGGNLQIDYRYPGSNAERLRTEAAELIKLQPDVIFADSTPALAAAQEATRTIPIVFAGVSDPIDLPIQLPTKFELVLNLTAAKELGREFPLSLLVRADELLE